MNASYPYINIGTGQTVYRLGAVGIPEVIYDPESGVDGEAFVTQPYSIMVVNPGFFGYTLPYISEEMTPDQESTMRCPTQEETEMFIFHHEFIHMTKDNIDPGPPLDSEDNPITDSTPRSKLPWEVDATTRSIDWIKSKFPHAPYPEC